MMEREHFLLMMAKAAEDEYIIDKLLGDEAAPIAAFGFHAQQAAEKMLKALLAAFGVAYPPTHRLSELIVLLGRQGLGLPDELRTVIQLSPFAVTYRYVSFSEDPEEQVDKNEIRKLLKDLRSWIEKSAEAHFNKA